MRTGHHYLPILILSTALLGQRNPAAPVLPFAEATPDTIIRGQVTRLVVKGRDAASLQSLKIEPADGIRIQSITPLPANSDGTASATVEIVADAGAALGERQMMLAMTAKITRSEATRPGGPPDKQLEAFYASVTKGADTSMEVGPIYVNSHPVTITNVNVAPYQNQRMIRITANDPTGDFAGEARPKAPATGIQVVLPPEWIVSEARCGTDVFDSPITEAVVAGKQGTSATIVAQLSIEDLSPSGPCTLRVRVRDTAGNTSGWFSVKLR
jgi:hypothetical protein